MQDLIFAQIITSITQIFGWCGIDVLNLSRPSHKAPGFSHEEYVKIQYLTNQNCHDYEITQEEGLYSMLRQTFNLLLQGTFN